MEGNDVRMTVEGTLLRHPEARRTLADRPVVIYLIESKIGIPVEVRVMLDDHAAAERLARDGRKGDHCEAIGAGALPRVDHDMAVLTLQRVRSVYVRGLRVFSSDQITTL